MCQSNVALPALDKGTFLNGYYLLYKRSYDNIKKSVFISQFRVATDIQMSKSGFPLTAGKPVSLIVCSVINSSLV